jgi:hypothetical protein
MVVPTCPDCEQPMRQIIETYRPFLIQPGPADPPELLSRIFICDRCKRVTDVPA